MAALSGSRRVAAGVALVVAGALFVLDTALLVTSTAVIPWLGLLEDFAMAAAFVILALGAVGNVTARASFIAGAVGWFFLGLNTVLTLPPGAATLALIAAGAGGLVGAIVLYTGREITDRSAIVFIVTMVLAALLLLSAITGIVLGVFGSILSLLFGAGLVITGVLFARVPRSRRR